MNIEKKVLKVKKNNSLFEKNKRKKEGEKTA